MGSRCSLRFVSYPPVDGNCRTMQTVEKQVVLEENWQVLAVVFPPFAQRLENPYHGLAGPVRCRSEFSTVPTASATAADYGQANGEQIWDGRCQPRPHLPIYRMTQVCLVSLECRRLQVRIAQLSKPPFGELLDSGDLSLAPALHLPKGFQAFQRELLFHYFGQGVGLRLGVHLEGCPLTVVMDDHVPLSRPKPYLHTHQLAFLSTLARSRSATSSSSLGGV